jgi:uncharacterized protein
VREAIISLLTEIHEAFRHVYHKGQYHINDNNFVGCDAIWDHFTATREDKRQDYGEERLVCVGLNEADVVVMVYTERPQGSHVISLRKAEKHEARYYRQVAKENLG